MIWKQTGTVGALLKDIAKMRPNMVPLTNDFIDPTKPLCKRHQRYIVEVITGSQQGVVEAF